MSKEGSIILIIISILWFVRTSKVVLFYLYLWQIKEYHIKRLLSHFRTAKGASLVFNLLNIIKIFLLSSLILLFYLLPIIYFSESLKAFLDFYKKRLKIPIITKKTAILITLVFSLEILFVVIVFLIIDFIVWFPVYFLIADLLTPLTVSLIVLIFQPLTYLVRRKFILKAQKKREKFPNLLVIGITGSYGKSSTKEFLYEILSEKYKVLKTQRNINAEIGIAQTILKELKPEHQVLIAEIGAYERGKIKEVCKMIKPKIGILTGINEQHMATFGSQENIIKAKFELIDSLPQNGTAILNGENRYIKERIKNYTLPAVIKTGVDIWAEDITVEKEFIIFKIKTKDGDSADFRINLMGKQNLENVLLAVCCAKELGMNLNEISAVCWKINSAQGGIKFLRREKPIVLDASYSANPNGVVADLEYLKLYQGKKLIVMPSLIELGRTSKEVHQKIGRKIAEVCSLAIITTKDHFKEIKDQAPNTLFIENPKEIAEKIKDFDLVLLEGRVPKELCQLLNQFQYL